MFKTMIERAEKAAGSQVALSEIIDQSPSKIRDAKSGRCGLPTYACVMIAEMIGEKPEAVIAASELTTEKKEKRRAFWEKKLEALAAGILLGVVSVVNPSPAEAAPILNLGSEHCILCKM